MREQSFPERWLVLPWLGPPQGLWGSGGRRADGECLVLRMLTWSRRGSRTEVTRGTWLQESGWCGGWRHGPHLHQDGDRGRGQHEAVQRTQQATEEARPRAGAQSRQGEWG